MPIKENDPAPEFKALDQHGKERSLKEFKGSWVLVYFYPKDDTPGCTKEACAFRDLSAELAKEVQIIGVSHDSVKSHQKFAEKYHLSFLLLSDPKKTIIEAYAAKGLLFTKRISYLINPQQKIQKIYLNVSPSTHAEEILEDVKKFK